MNYNINEEDLFHILDYMDEIDSICIGADSPNALNEIKYCPQQACENMQKDITTISNLSDKIYEVFKKVLANNIGGNN